MDILGINYCLVLCLSNLSYFGFVNFDIKFGYILRNTEIVDYETRLIPTLRCNNGMDPIEPHYHLYDWCKAYDLIYLQTVSAYE